MTLDNDMSMGVVSSSTWADYAWKNELDLQHSRVITHLDEIQQDLETDHNPHHMLERAFSLTAFCMRRLIECRLITDSLREGNIRIYEIPRQSSNAFRENFLHSTSGHVFKNYDLTQRIPQHKKVREIINRFLPARILHRSG